MHTVAEDVFTITFSGLSKTWRVAGYRSGWIYISGPTHRAKNYLEGLQLMRICACAPMCPVSMRHPDRVGRYQSIKD